MRLGSGGAAGPAHPTLLAWELALDHDAAGALRADLERLERDLAQVVSELRRRAQAREFELLAIGGPSDPLSALEADLPDDLSTLLVGRLSIDPSAASEARGRHAFCVRPCG